MKPADVLILGAGCAGLYAALQLAGLRVAVIKPEGAGGDAASAWAQGGIAAAQGADDAPALHAKDTLLASGGIGDAEVAASHAALVKARVADLLALGVKFDRDDKGNFQLGREAAHQKNRTVRVRGDRAGRAIMAALTARAEEAEHIEFLSGHRALQLVADDVGMAGAWLHRLGQAPFFLPVRAVLLASGGIGHLYATTSNPVGAWGEGLGMALQAGAEIADAEFVQFHATALDIGADPAPLASEALRGEGAFIIDETGTRFLKEVDPRGELAPRDITARALAEHIAAGHKGFLDLRHCAKTPGFAEQFAIVFSACHRAGLDPARDLLPIAPAAHYHMGGVAVDGDGAASIPGLWVCGEAAGSGLHGANRLAGNALGEALVLGWRAAQRIRDIAPPKPASAPQGQPPSPAELKAADATKLRTAMTRHAGLVRNAEGLEELLDLLAGLRRDYMASSPAGNRLVAAQLVALAALRRQESRGAHFRSDFPNPNPAFAKRFYLNRGDIIAELSGLRPIRP